MTFVLATHNQGKLKEMRKMLSLYGHELLSLQDLHVTEVPEETGCTFEENARIKAHAACKATGLAAIADDSGLCVDALDGAPGVFSARYGGVESDSGRIEYLLTKMDGVTDRQAHFETAIIGVFPDGKELLAFGDCSGVLLEKPQGTGGFGYDPIFFIPALDKTFAQLSSDEKNKLSHRGKALRAFVSLLEIHQKQEEKNIG